MSRSANDTGARRVVHPLLVLAMLAVLFLLFANILTSGFEKLGLSHSAVLVVLFASIGGSVINIPVRQRTLGGSPDYMTFGGMVFYRPPRIAHQVIAINVGGALVPFALSLWLLWRAPLIQTGVATVCIVILTHRLAHIEPGSGIVMPTLIPPLAALILALALAGGRSPDTVAIAYVSGSMGSLIGADLMNLPRLSQVGPGVLSIGGAGVFDGVFLVGIIAALLA